MDDRQNAQSFTCSALLACKPGAFRRQLGRAHRDASYALSRFVGQARPDAVSLCSEACFPATALY